MPYRRTQFGVEFCLVTPLSQNRWEFPKAAISEANSPAGELLEQAATEAGLHGRIESEPLGHFAAKRGNESRTMVAHLMQVVEVADAWPRQANHKRQWCLAEECRVRIRRKPLRQFIDAALHAVAALSSEPAKLNGNGNGHGNGKGHGRNGNGHAASR